MPKFHHPPSSSSSDAACSRHTAHDCCCAKLSQRAAIKPGAQKPSTMAVTEQAKQHHQREAMASRAGEKTTDGISSSINNSNNLWETMLRDAMRRNRLPDGTLLFVGSQGCGKSSLLDTFLEGSASSANPSGGAAAAAAAAAVVAPIAEKGPEGGSGSGGGGTGASSGGGVGASGGAAGDTVGAANARGFHPVLAYSYLDATDPAEQGPERDDSPPRVSVWCCSELEFEGLLQTVLRPEQLLNTVVAVGVDLSRPWEVMESLEKVSGTRRWSCCGFYRLCVICWRWTQKLGLQKLGLACVLVHWRAAVG